MTKLLLVLAMTASSTVLAAPLTLSADVEYDFIDKNGMGWGMTAGKVTVTITINGKAGTLAIKGKRSTNDALLVAGKTPGGGPDVKSTKWEGEVDESYPIYDVVKTGDTFAFKVDPVHDKLTGSCAPIKVAKIKSTTLYECSIVGFQWKSIAQMPEVHHPIVLDAKANRGGSRILNKFHGAAKPQFGQRAVSVVTPKPKPKPKKP